MDYLEDVEGLAPDNVVTEFQNHFHHAIPSLEDNDESVAMAFDVLDNIDNSVFNESLCQEVNTLGTEFMTEDEMPNDEQEERDLFDPLTNLPVDENDELVVHVSILAGCGCNRNCVEKFSKDELIESHLSCAGLNYYCKQHVNHLNLFLQGSLNALFRTGTTTLSKSHKHHERKACYTEYQFRGIVVCSKFFSFVNGVGERRLKNAKKDFHTNGVHERVHKNTISTSKVRAVSPDRRSEAEKFIINFAQIHGLVLPGRLPFYRLSTDVILLPSAMTKKYVHKMYTKACITEEVSLRTWYRLWSIFCANIVIQKPRWDLCAVCQKSITSMGCLAALPVLVKEKRIAESFAHLELVKRERQHYKDIIEKCRAAVVNSATKILLGIRQPSSWDGIMHYSFDYAQQIFLPYDSQQCGPLYFLAGYKVGLFGIAIEPIHKFVLYIIPEAGAVGKGANSVISFLDHFFTHFGFGENEAVLHADNCVGQNKNQYVLQYLVYRTLIGKHKKIRLSFLPAGHTKFSPDLYFGIFKKLFSVAVANCLKDILKIALQCKYFNVVLVCNESGDEIYVPTCDWVNFFKNHRATTAPNITKYHHFETENDGYIRFREFSDSTWHESKNIFPTVLDASKISLDVSPNVCSLLGLTHKRKTYLFKKIRPYVKKGYRNILCPKPEPLPVQKTTIKQALPTLKELQRFVASTPKASVSRKKTETLNLSKKVTPSMNKRISLCSVASTSKAPVLKKKTEKLNSQKSVTPLALKRQSASKYVELVEPQTRSSSKKQ